MTLQGHDSLVLCLVFASLTRYFIIKHDRHIRVLARGSRHLGENTSRLRKIDHWATQAKQGTTRLPDLEKRRLRYQRSYDCRLGYLRIYGPTTPLGFLPDPFINYLSTT